MLRIKVFGAFVSIAVDVGITVVAEPELILVMENLRFAI